jgi:hypothetical protein
VVALISNKPAGIMLDVVFLNVMERYLGMKLRGSKKE